MTSRDDIIEGIREAAYRQAHNPRHPDAPVCLWCTRTFLLEEIDKRDKALALLRELNDALAIPDYLQPRVEAVLDRAEEKS